MEQDLVAVNPDLVAITMNQPFHYGSTPHSPSSLVTHIEALLSTGIRLQTHKDSSCRYTRPGLQASLTVQPATSCQP